jgi:DNA-directed RNA polymerase subunit E'/Rpb7
MNYSDNIIFDVFVSPSDINTINLKQYLQSKYNNLIYNGKFIMNVTNVNKVQYGKVTSNGNINVIINTLCDVLDPIINNTYNLVITNYNKLGSFINIGKISIFIPKEYSINEEIPSIGVSINVKIIGKRIEDKITCIGRQLN